MSLGSIVVRLTMNTADFDTDTKRAASIAKKRADEIDKSFRIAGAAVAASLGALAVGVFRATAEAEKSQAQLAAALKSTGGVAGLTQDELNGMADELQNVTTFGDEAITSAQALMLTFTRIGEDVFPEAIAAALDMSTALGKDLQSSVTQLGKALNDPLKGVAALAEAGVQFSDDQKAMIEALVETGREADAQRIILAELETQFGGSAVAARDTLGGALQALENAFGELLEGDTGGDGVRGTKAAIEQLTGVLQSSETRQAFAGMIEDAAGLGAELVSLLAKLDAIAGFMRGEADTQGALGAYGETLAGVADKEKSLRESLARLESSDSTHVGFERREEAIARVRAELEKTSRILEHFSTLEGSFNAASEAGASIDLAANRDRLLATDGEEHVISPGSESWEWNLAPRVERGRSGARTREDVQTTAEYFAELQKLAEEERQQMDRWSEMVAQLDGPLAEAEYAHTQRQEELREAGEAAGATSEEIAAALALETEAHLENVAAIKAQEDPFAQLLEDMQFEAELLKMSNAERATAIQLRGADAEAIARYSDELLAANESLEAQAEAVDAMDEFRDSFADNVQDVLTGTKSIEDAFRSLADSVLDQIARMIAEDWTAKLFGSMGSSDTGSAGGMFASLFSAFASGGSGGASTGSVDFGSNLKGILPGSKSLTAASESVPFPFDAAASSPSRGKAGVVIQNNTFAMPGRYDLRTQGQIAADVHRAGQRAAVRGTA